MDSELLTVPDDRAEHAKFIADLAVASTAPDIVIIETKGLGDGLPDKVPVGFDRKAQAFVSLKHRMEEFRLKPAQRKGTATVDTLQSFVALIDRHKTADSVIFGLCKWPEPKLTAVIDYHTLKHAPDWLSHRVIYPFPLTEEFKTWVAMNNQPMEQGLFAAFIEDHAAEIAAPSDAEKIEFERLFKERFATPSELLTLSRELEVFVGAKAKRGERLQTGERVVEFTTEHTNGKGEKIDIPGIFMLSVPAFIDGEAVRIPARLRYRIAAGEILWFYSLYRWEFWLREQVQRDLKDAAAQTKLPFFEGEPEKAESR